MKNTNIIRALGYVADSVESGYTALFTFGIKEVLEPQERSYLARSLRDLALELSTTDEVVPLHLAKVLINDGGEAGVGNTSNTNPNSPTSTQH